MFSTRQGYAWTLCGTALFLVLFIAPSARAQDRKYMQQDSPLERDPTRPTNYEREMLRKGTVSPVEEILKEGNAACEESPPRYSVAEAAYKQAAKLDPKDARAFVGLGKVYAALNRLDETIEAFQQAIELNPKSTEARFNLGLVFSATGKKDKALEQYNALLNLNKDLAKKLKKFMDQ